MHRGEDCEKFKRFLGEDGISKGQRQFQFVGSHMISTPEFGFVMLCLMLVIIIALAWIFRDKVRTWDSLLKKRIAEFGQDASLPHAPGLYYECEDQNVRHNFAVVGTKDFETSLIAISQLRSLALGNYDAAPKSKTKNDKPKNPISQ